MKDVIEIQANISKALRQVRDVSDMNPKAFLTEVSRIRKILKGGLINTGIVQIGAVDKFVVNEIILSKSAVKQIDISLISKAGTTVNIMLACRLYFSSMSIDDNASKLANTFDELGFLLGRKSHDLTEKDKPKASLATEDKIHFSKCAKKKDVAVLFDTVMVDEPCFKLFEDNGFVEVVAWHDFEEYFTDCKAFEKFLKGGRYRQTKRLFRIVLDEQDKMVFLFYALN